MKKFYLAALGIFAGTLLQAQSLTITPSVMNLEMAANSSAYKQADLHNPTSVDQFFEYTVIMNTLDPGWDLQFCDPNYCFLNVHNSDTFSVSRGAHDIMKLEIFANGVSNTGTLSIKIWNSNAPSDLDTVTWHVNTTLVGLTDRSLEHNVSIFPNPVQDQLNLQAIHGTLEKGTLSILDVTGKLQLSTQVLGTAAMEIDTRTLAPGAYLLRYEANGAVLNRKFIKAN